MLKFVVKYGKYSTYKWKSSRILAKIHDDFHQATGYDLDPPFTERQARIQARPSCYRTPNKSDDSVDNYSQKKKNNRTRPEKKIDFEEQYEGYLKRKQGVFEDNEE